MKKKFYWIYVPVFINILGVGMIFPILPLFAQTFKASAFEVGLLISLLSFVQFLAAPFLGKLSDRHGRKPVLLFSIAMNTTSFIVTGTAHSLNVVFLGMALQGLGTAGVLPTALAYIADVTEGHARSRNIARVTGTFGLGFFVGPAIGGFLGGVSLSLPFFMAFGAGITNFLITTFILKETLTKKDMTSRLRDGLISPKPLAMAIKGKFGVLFFQLFMWSFYIAHFSLITPFFTQEVFKFDSVHIGLLFSAVGLTAAITQWVLLPKIEEKIGDLKTILLGNIVIFIGVLLTPLTPIVQIFVFLTILTVIGSATLRPSINAFLSKHTTEGQGATLGLAFSFESLGRVIGPIVVGLALSNLGLVSPYILTAALLLVGVVVFYFVEMKRG